MVCQRLQSENVFTKERSAGGTAQNNLMFSHSDTSQRPLLDHHEPISSSSSFTQGLNGHYGFEERKTEQGVRGVGSFPGNFKGFRGYFFFFVNLVHLKICISYNSYKPIGQLWIFLII